MQERWALAIQTQCLSLDLKNFLLLQGKCQEFS